MKRHYLLPMLLVLSLMLTVSAAANITYNAQSNVAGTSVTGSIVTDGTLGTIGSADILSFALTLNDGTGTDTLISGVSGIVAITSNNVTATPTELLFDFNGNGGLMNFFSIADCSPPEWSFETTGSGSACNGTVGNQEGVAAVLPFGSGVYQAQQGEVVFATTGTTTPEPSSLMLMGTGALGVLGLLRRKLNS